jgi:hypothetical protein
LIDGQSRSYDLDATELQHIVEAGRVEILKASVGSAPVFDTIDLQSGQPSISAARVIGDGWDFQSTRSNHRAPTLMEPRSLFLKEACTVRKLAGYSDS